MVMLAHISCPVRYILMSPWLGPVQLPLTAPEGYRLSAGEALQLKFRAAGFLLEENLVDLTFKSMYCTFLGFFAHPGKPYEFLVFA